MSIVALAMNLLLAALLAAALAMGWRLNRRLKTLRRLDDQRIFDEIFRNFRAVPALRGEQEALDRPVGKRRIRRRDRNCLDPFGSRGDHRLVRRQRRRRGDEDGQHQAKQYPHLTPRTRSIAVSIAIHRRVASGKSLPLCLHVKPC